MEQYKISIITASYNSAKTIEQTIISVIRQTYKSIEFIIIDGGSTDGTVEIIKKYSDKISFWISEPDQGVYDAFNKGVRYANGDFVQFLGSDDCLCDEKTIETIADNIDKDTDVLSTPIWLVDETQRMQKLMSNANAIDKKQFNGEMIPHPGMFTRKELLEKHPFNISYRIAADYLFFLTCYYDCTVNFKFIDNPSVLFSTEGLSSTPSLILEEEKQKVRTKFGVIIKKSFKDIAKMWIKQFLEKIHALKLVYLLPKPYIYRGWEKHKCNWEKCRWCKRL